MTVRDFKKDEAALSDNETGDDQKYESEMAEMMRELVAAKMEAKQDDLDKSTDLAVPIEDEDTKNHSMTAKQAKSNAKSKKNSRDWKID